jgi:hypothetical protein
MAKRSHPLILAQLLEKFSPAVQQAFFDAVNDLRSGADLAALTAALAKNDATAALAALNLEPSAYNGLAEALRGAFSGAGAATSAAIPAVRAAATGARLVFRFDGTNPIAEAWLKRQSSTLITRILADQREAVRAFLAEGMGAGINPRETALNIIGRISKATGKREGGIIGLTTPQSKYVSSAYKELASGDPKLLANYLTRTRRNRTFDGIVRDAIAAEEPVAASDAAAMITSYSNRLLQTRGETLSKTETFNALEASRNESYRQAEEKSGAKATKKWRHLPSKHPRPMHIAMNNKVVAINEPFVLPDGTKMQYPHDTSAPAEHTVNCLCQADYRLDYLGAR